MAQINRLTALTATQTRKPGLHHDGAGLYLQVTTGKHGVTKSWLYRFVLDGKERRMGLGAFNDVSLAEARESAARARWIISRRVHDAELRTFVAILSVVTEQLCKKTLYGTIATIANVVFSRNDMTGSKVREMLRSPPGA